MKKHSVVIGLILSVVMLVACSKGTLDYEDYREDVGNRNPVLGTWVVVEGSDKHIIVIDDDNTLRLIDGGDTITAEYIFEDDILTIITSDEDIGGFTFELDDDMLFRYDMGEEDGYKYRKKDERMSKDNPMLGKWTSETEVGHLIENTFGYEDVAFDMTVEYCFKEDNTFTFKVLDVNEDDLMYIFEENRGDSPDETVQARMEGMRDSLYFQSDQGSYEIQDGKLIMNGKQGALELQLEIIDDTTVQLTYNDKTEELDWIDVP